MNTQAVQTWADVRFNHKNKRFEVVIGELDSEQRYTTELVFKSFEAAEHCAAEIRTFCPLCFEYPTNEDGSISFY